MSNDPLPTPLLSYCAILRFFNRDILIAVGEHDAATLMALFVSDLVQPAPAPGDTFQLRDEIRATVLANLRAQRPGDELLLHEQALAYFLARMQQPTSPAQRLIDEDCCFYHLDLVRLPLSERREWQQLWHHVANVRAVQPQRLRHIQRIALYDGLIAIQTQDYATGEVILNVLLNQADVEDEVRMRALNILAHSHWHQTQYDRARQLYQRVHDVARAKDDRLFQGFALMNMSLIDHEIGYYERAFDLSMRSLELFRLVADSYHGDDGWLPVAGLTLSNRAALYPGRNSLSKGDNACPTTAKSALVGPCPLSVWRYLQGTGGSGGGDCCVSGGH